MCIFFFPITSPNFLLIFSHSQDLQPKVESSSLGHLSIGGCQLYCAPAENRACLPFLGHLSRALGSAMGQHPVLFSPFLLHFVRSAKSWFSLLKSIAHTFAQLRAGVLHNSPWCRHHRLLRPALRYTSLHAVQYCCTIPLPHTLFHFTTPHHRCWKAKHSISPYISPQARDLDTGRNAEVRLSIVAGNGDGKFRIDPISGMLYVAAPLDAEKKTRYTLTVAALDQANAGVRKQSSARVRILVTDVNDNEPKFPRNQKTIYFDENEPGRTRVTRVNAKDADSGENQQISYSIANPDADEIPFVIDHSNGVIKSTRLVDFESDRREYKLQVWVAPPIWATAFNFFSPQVRASDWGQPFRRQSELRLTIRIKDINDNRPQVIKARIREAWWPDSAVCRSAYRCHKTVIP